MKILYASEMQQAERYTFETCGISQSAVMENAGRSVVETIFSELGRPKSIRSEAVLSPSPWNHSSESNKADLATSANEVQSVAVFCGSGNNGGDGFVVARLLLQRFALEPLLKMKTAVRVYSFLEGRQSKDSALAQRNAYEKLGGEVIEVGEMNCSEALSTLREQGPQIIVDAIYGIGFKGKLSLTVQAFTFESQRLREKGSILFAVDIPSGLEADSHIVSDDSVIHADITVTFQFLKPAMVMLPAALCCGSVVVQDVGIAVSTPVIEKIQRNFVERSMVERILRNRFPPESFLHKGDRGHVVVVGGSEGKYGAPVLSGISALRSGAGLATLCVSNAGMIEALQAYPELMTILLPDGPSLNPCVKTTDNDSEQKQCDELELALTKILKRGRGAVVCGPGLGTDERAKRLFEQTVSACKASGCGLVIDADGLNLLSRDKKSFTPLPPHTVLTPHPGEMGTLLGIATADVENDRLNVAARAAREFECVVILKGARTVIATPRGSIWINPAAAEVMATAGSGDVLAGVIATLLVRGCDAEEAAICACYAHGEVGTLRQNDIAGLSASLILAEIPVTLNLLLAGSGLLMGERTSTGAHDGPTLNGSSIDDLSAGLTMGYPFVIPAL